MSELDEQMADALGRQADAAERASLTDRRGWTKAQWADDAEALMHEPDGAITSLVNGHAMGLIAERKRMVEVLTDIAFWFGPGNNWARVRSCEALGIDPRERHPFDSCVHSCCDRKTGDVHLHEVEPRSCDRCRYIWRHQS